mmetsp:Transcript_5747/g.16126  ORF Transcript_5747/g.16126 Transcript_5747/m.16126 type:complete len:474 (-) Transcript_5747:128-1549(-)
MKVEDAPIDTLEDDYGDAIEDLEEDNDEAQDDQMEDAGDGAEGGEAVAGTFVKLDDEGDTAIENKPVPGGQDDPLSLPPHGTEVFIGGLPRAATEEDVTAFCTQAGELHSLRLVKDPGNPTQQNKGFAFGVYKTVEAAKAASEQLNGKDIPGHPGSKPVRVVISSVKNRLFLGNIPKDLTKSFIEEEVKKACVGVEAIDMLPGHGTDGNPGFAFVEFYNHAAADMGRRALGPPAFTLNGKTINVTWADPKKEETTSVSPSEIKSIYVSKLPAGANSEKLKELFSCHGAIERVAIPPPKRTPHPEFAFIHFTERSSALAAVKACEETPAELDGTTLDVAMARTQPEARPYGYSSQMSGRGRGSPGRGGVYYGSGAPGRGSMPPPANPYSGGMMGADFSRMAMVPMMLPNGQVGYVLQEAPYGMDPSIGYGPVRGGGAPGGYGGPPQGGRYGADYGRGRGRGGRHMSYNSRYQPY